ncbi:MAG: YtxH domain-containing protein [Aquaticitalea sp.]
MKKQQGKGLVALLGVGAGLYAWWKYRNMTPEKKAELHSQVNEVGKKIKDTVRDVESNVSQQYDQLKNSVKREVNDVTQE